MKISKLKYVFAFVLMVAVSVVTTNVKAATMPNDGQIKISTIIASQLAAIEDGDEPSTSTYENLVYLFNSGYSTSDSALGAAMNPVYAYAIKNSTTGTYSKVYGLNYGNTAVDREGVDYTGIGQGSDVDNKIGLGLAFGLNYLTSSQAADQENLDAYTKASAQATQMYIWIVKAGLLGSAQENAIVNANLSGTALARYTSIKNAVQSVSNNPSYTYGTQNDAKSHPIEMNWNAENGRYEYTVTDDNGLDTMSLVNLIIESNSGIQYSKNGNSVTFYTTEQVGSVNEPTTIAVYKSINNGRWVPGYASSVKNGQQFVYLTARQNANTATYISFYTNALRIKVNKNLVANSNNSKTGDATREGAVYGIYTDRACNDNQLVQRITTDANGVALSNPLEFRNYYVKELNAPAGCKIDTAVHDALTSAANTEANGQRVVTVTSNEQVIYGGFRLIVSISDLSGNTTKEPAVGSKLKLTLKSNANEFYEATVDENGYAEFTTIPYGQYTCTEIKKVKPELDFMDPMDIFINSEETYIYSKLVNTEVAQRNIKIEKRDAETGNLVPASNIAFQIKDSEGRVVTQKVMYPEPMELSIFTTDPQGYLVMPDKLPYGTYTIYEKVAPTGYYNESEDKGIPSATFKVESNTVEHPEKDMVVVVVRDMPQKVNVNISTRGQVLSGTNTVTVDGKEVKQPAYQVGNIPGAVYRLTATKDIVSGDKVTVHMRAGETKDFTADANGNVKFKLYLGTYTIEQISVPEGYVLNKEKKTLTLAAREQTVKEWDESFVYSNTIQSYEVNLTKEFKDLAFYKQDEDDSSMAKYSNVVVGIYAAEDITNVAGQVKIAKDTLVDVVRMNNDGRARVAADLPTGKFYAKEIATDENYILSDKKYDVITKPSNNSEQLFIINVEKIVNEPKKVTKLTLTKIEEVEVKENKSLLTVLETFAEGVLNGGLSNVEKTTKVTRLADAEYSVFYKGTDGKYYALLEKVDGELVEVVRTTDKNGEIVLEGLPFGEYAVQETKAPRYYDLDSAKYAFEVTTANPTKELVLQDVRTKVDVTVTVKDEDGNLLEDVKVDLVNPETNKVAYTVTTDENGVANFKGVRADRYIRRVSGLAEEYVIPEDAQLYAEKDVKAEVEVKFVKGNVTVYKTDAETGEPVPGCKFKVTNELEEIVAEGESDENGYFRVEGLRYGAYFIEETEAAEGYEKSEDIYKVIIEKDGAELVVDFTNVPTGDIAVVAYAMVALISLAVIVRTVKKMKMN